MSALPLLERVAIVGAVIRASRQPNVARKLDLSCTKWTHDRIGIDAVINARGGEQWRNHQEQEEIEMYRDAQAIRDRIERRVRCYQFCSLTFRRRLPQLAHLLSERNEDLTLSPK